MLFAVKLFSEITIKSRPVRRRMIRILRRNIRRLLVELDPGVTATGEWDAIEIETVLEGRELEAQIIDVLANIPGISGYQRVEKFPLPDYAGIAELCKKYYGESLNGKTFCVRVKRSGKHAFRSVDVEKIVGGMLFQQTANAGVKLENPDVTVELEIRQDLIFLISRKFKGQGGFPLGTQDGVLSLISGGFDSAVSSYMCIRRGLLTHYCFFNLGGRAHELAVKEVALYLWMKFGSSHKVNFVTVPFEKVVEEILTKVENSQMGVVLKRMMMQAAGQMANKLNLQALVTGESVAQVSSQTLANLAQIDAISKVLTLRPLITTDKQDIINIARSIGTEEFSKSIPEYCAVISVKPTTRARAWRLEAEEAKFNFALLDDAVAAASVQAINQVANDLSSPTSEPELVTSLLPGTTLIDIRHPREEELQPLHLPDHNVKLIKVPFYRLHSFLEGQDHSERYLLYCGKGLMSRLHAAYLLDAGFANVVVYAPAKNPAGADS